MAGKSFPDISGQFTARPAAGFRSGEPISQSGKIGLLIKKVFKHLL
jgi:hypothetical protein